MTERLSKDAIIRELQSAGAVVKGTTVKCPFHEDRKPSGHIYQSEDDRVWRYKCHATTCDFCGDLYDIRARATNRPLADVLRETNQQPKAPQPKIFKTIDEIEASVSGTIESKHPYTNPNTHKPDLIVLRIKDNGKRTFLQVSPQGNGFILKAPPKPWPIYNRIELQNAEQVIVVEGEKCVHQLRKARFVGTTSPAGAGKAQYADWTPLAGKTVYVWPDNDEAGVTHGLEVVQQLDKLEPSPKVFWINPIDLNLSKGGDVVDFLGSHEVNLHHSAILSVLETSEPVGASTELHTILEDTISGKRSAITWPWPMVTNLTKALLPGTVTLICGEPSSAKSFFLLQALAYWHDEGVKVAVFELEETRAYHLNRVLAQKADKADIFDPDWIRENPDEVRAIFGEHKDFLDSFGKCIYEAPHKQTDLKCLTQWVETKANDGCRIIAIDPVTAAQDDKYTWIADSEFMFAVKAIVREYGISLVLVTHPRKGRKQTVGLDELAGGAAYQRFSQTVMWVVHHKQPKTVLAAMPVGRTNCQINRTLQLIKTRNGRGYGLGIGFRFCGDSLKFAEQGVIIPEKKE